MNLRLKICLFALLACVSLVANASVVITENNDEVTMVVTDESYTLTVDQTQDILYVAFLDVFLPGGAAVYDSSRVSGSATMSVNGGAATNLDWWTGWQYRPGTQSPWTPEDVSFLFQLTTGTLQAGDVITINGTLTMDATSNPNIVVPDVTGTVPTAIGGHTVYYSDITSAELSTTPQAVGDTANIQVTKTFSDGRDDAVDVTLTCNTGLPLQQTATIVGGDPAGVTFVVRAIPDGGATCEVTESGGPDGYTPVMNDGAGCTWEGVVPGNYACQITNVAGPATFTVNVEWLLGDGNAEDIVQETEVTVYCDNEIEGGSWNGSSWMYSEWLAGDDSLEVTVDTALQSAQCYAEQTVVTQSGVESVDDCGSRTIAVGGSSSCTFTNTVFFEGIPTLSQWGLAVLVMLTLGVGLVSFRRFA